MVHPFRVFSVLGKLWRTMPTTSSTTQDPTAGRPLMSTQSGDVASTLSEGIAIIVFGCFFMAFWRLSCVGTL